MRYPIYGRVIPNFTVSVYDAGTTTPSTIYKTSEGGSSVSTVTADSEGAVVFYVDDVQYPFPSYFDLKIGYPGYTDVWLYNVWSYFVSAIDTISASEVSDYTFGRIRSRLADFYSLNVEDTQVKAILDECIQTGYEKVVSMVNFHNKQRSITFDSVSGTMTYGDVHLGIPTYVGYKAKRLKYLPYEVLREKYENFDGEWESTADEPEYYSLLGFNGKNKTLYIVPTPKDTGEVINVLCFQTPPQLRLDSDYPLVPADWAWLVLERAKIERLRFEGDMEAYQIQAQEFVAYVKVMLNRCYPAAPEPEAGWQVDTERIQYNAWRSRRI